MILNFMMVEELADILVEVKRAIYSGKREVLVRRGAAHPETLRALENIGIHSGILENTGICRLTWNDTSEVHTTSNTAYVPLSEYVIPEEDNSFPTPHYTPEEPCSDYGFEGGGF